MVAKVYIIYVLHTISFILEKCVLVCVNIAGPIKKCVQIQMQGETQSANGSCSRCMASCGYCRPLSKCQFLFTFVIG